ncbi:MAG TPA: Gfo/Idh/MocA family oxidoreductase [Sphingomicrobium sp.]|nr:Gfo/Idh/MocA family oxidoreductase [Sphingomicrobium sp.]
MTNSPPIRLAIIGVGKIARDQHLTAVAVSPDFELVATVSPHGRVNGVPGFDSIEHLLGSGVEIDAVSICTPPVGRSGIAAAAIDAGLDVMFEKPPAATLAEVEALERRALTAGRILFASWHSREAAGVAAARDWLAGRRIERAQIAWREDIRRWHPGQDWILAAGGFGVFDPGINALSILTAILSQPVFVEAAELSIPAGRAGPVAASVKLRSDGAEISAEFDFLHQGPQQWDISVETSQGRLMLRQGGRVLDIDGTATEGLDQEYPRLYARFAELIRARQSDVDIAPLRLVADAFLIGSRRDAPEFSW